MNRKQLIMIIVAGVVLGAVGLMMYNKEQGSWSQTARPRERLVPNFPLNDVTQITIKQAAAEVNLVKKDDQWTLKERADFAANYSDITEFLRKLWEMKGGQPVKVTKAQLERLELISAGVNPATQVICKDKSGKVLSTLWLGKKHMRKSAEGPMGGGEWPDGRYVMVGDELASVCLLSEAFSNMEPKAEQWLQKDLFKVEKVKSVALVSPQATNSWKMTRETEAGEWKLADAQKDEQLDSVKASSAASAMASASLTDVVAADAKADVTGLDQATVATIETFDGFTYTLKFGKKTSDDNNYHVGFAVAASLSKERTPGKDEKKEDKDKLDKEFSENLKKLDEKLQKEKQFEKWNYLISKWTAESLFKPRHEMLAAKKDEKKEEPKAGENK